MNTHNIGLIGCGRISSRHLQAIQIHPNARLTHVCDIELSRAQALAQSSQQDVRVSTSILELAQDPDVHVVSICTPSGTHARLAETLLLAGKHVIIEKPIALNTQDAELVIAAQKRSGCLALPVMQNRFNPAIEYLQTHRDQLGSLHSLCANVFWYRPQSYYDDGVHGTKDFDGGVLANQAIHYIDMMCYLAQEPVTSVCAFGATRTHKMECEDVISVMLKFEHGLVGSLNANTFSVPENMEGSITLWFDHATVKIGGTALNQITYWRGKGEEGALHIGEDVPSVYGFGHNRVLENLLSHLESGTSLYTTLEEQHQVVSILDAAYRSLEQGCIISL